jgi:hypothetical protein
MTSIWKGTKAERATTSVAFLMLFFAASAGATEWNAETHILASGDFNNDGKADLLVIAKDESEPSGIALGDGSGQPSTFHQSWSSSHLGITWHSGTYVPHVGDFNGDNHDDVFLQRVSGGNHYILLSDANSKLTSIYQAMNNSALGISWSQVERRIEVGDFNNDGRDDLFLQSNSVSVDNVVAFANGGGYFTINHTWPNAYVNLQWNLPKALEYAGQFDADGYAEPVRPSQARLDPDSL